MINAPRLSFGATLSAWLPVILWAAVIWHFSSIPNLRILDNWWDFPLRKLAHMSVFAVLARLLARALIEQTYWSWKKIFAWSLALTVFYACGDEIHQGFVAHRHASFVDVLIDATGAWLALGLRP